MYYYYQRWYDQSTGRFISQDPAPGVSTGSTGSYAYVYDTPTTLADPSGMTAVSPRICVDICGRPDMGWSIILAFAVLSSVDVTHHLGGIGEGIDPYSCEWCISNYNNIGPNGENAVSGPTSEDPVLPTVNERGLGTQTIAGGAESEANSLSPAASVSELGRTPLNWPADAQGMEDLLGKPGASVPDLLETPGRGQMVWEIRSDPQMEIVGEQHPYTQDIASIAGLALACGTGALLGLSRDSYA